MIRNIWMIALSLTGASAFADSSRLRDGQVLEVMTVAPATMEGYQAEVEVSWRGQTQQGRIIVTGDGTVHLEHLDTQTSRWAQDMLRPLGTASSGWNHTPQRYGPIHRSWRLWGHIVVPSKIGTPEGFITFERHKSISSR